MARMKAAPRAPHLRGPAPWHASPATYLAGRAHIDGVDALAIEMERKWGVDRLRLLVGPELREKFDRQRVKLNMAMQTGEVADVQRESQRTLNAWMALDRSAEAVGAKKLSPAVWEHPMSNGALVAIVRDSSDGHAVLAEGRAVQLWTLDEIVRVIEKFPEIAKAKVVWPGAKVTAIRQQIDDPIKDIDESELNDDIPF
jgi:hypothetical protein